MRWGIAPRECDRFEAFDRRITTGRRGIVRARFDDANVIDVDNAFHLVLGKVVALAGQASGNRRRHKHHADLHLSPRASASRRSSKRAACVDGCEGARMRRTGQRPPHPAGMHGFERSCAPGHSSAGHPLEGTVPGAIGGASSYHRRGRWAGPQSPCSTFG